MPGLSQPISKAVLTRGVASLAAALALLTVVSMVGQGRHPNAALVAGPRGAGGGGATVLLGGGMPSQWSQEGFTQLRDDGYSAFRKLGHGWTSAKDSDGKTYYFNQKQGLSQWDPPSFLTSSLSSGGGSPRSSGGGSRAAAASSPYTAEGGDVAEPEGFDAPEEEAGGDGEVGGGDDAADGGDFDPASKEEEAEAYEDGADGGDFGSDPEEDGASGGGDGAGGGDGEDAAAGDDDAYDGGVDGSGVPLSLSGGGGGGEDWGEDGGGRRQRRHQQALSAALKRPGTEEIATIGDADWPADLPGAQGDDTSWIVGEHREPLWSDSQTGACGTTTPCPKGLADRGHAMQRTTNPFVDKRRTFDPYAQSSEGGRRAYPWDPTRDPQAYKTGDCSGGKLTGDCLEPLSPDEVAKKQGKWHQTYDEWYDAAAKAEDEAQEKAEEGGEEAEKEGKAAAKAAARSLGAMLARAEGMLPKNFAPWTHRGRHGAARGGGGGAYEGGHPLSDSAGRILGEVREEIRAGSEKLRGLEEEAGKLVGGERGVGGGGAAARRARTTSLAEEAPAAGGGQGAGGGVSIWESPLQVASHGLFGGGSAPAAAPPAPHMAGAPKKGAAAKGPLPPVAKAVESVVSREGGGAARAAAEAKGGKAAKVDPWQEKQMQRGAMQRQSTKANLGVAVRHHDDSLLKKVAGVSRGALRAMESDAEALENKLEKHGGGHGGAKATGGGWKRAAKPRPPPAGTVAGWQQRVMQQGALRRQSVEGNLKEALTARERKMLAKKGGWKSEGALERAERFAENLGAAVSARHIEEKGHPLIPGAAKKLLAREEGAGGGGGDAARLAAIRRGVRAQRRKEEVQREREQEPVVEAYEQKVRDDEREYAAEARGEEATLRQLGRDQRRLAGAVRKQAAAGGRGKEGRGKEGRGAKGKEGGGVVGQKLAADGATGAVGPGGAGLSAGAAERDLDRYFDQQQARAAGGAQGGGGGL